MQSLLSCCLLTYRIIPQDFASGRVNCNVECPYQYKSRIYPHNTCAILQDYRLGRNGDWYCSKNFTAISRALAISASIGMDGAPPFIWCTVQSSMSKFRGYSLLIADIFCKNNFQNRIVDGSGLY